MIRGNGGVHSPFLKRRRHGVVGSSIREHLAKLRRPLEKEGGARFAVTIVEECPLRNKGWRVKE